VSAEFIDAPLKEARASRAGFSPVSGDADMKGNRSASDKGHG